VAGIEQQGVHGASPVNVSHGCGVDISRFEERVKIEGYPRGVSIARTVAAADLGTREKLETHK